MQTKRAQRFCVLYLYFIYCDVASTKKTPKTQPEPNTGTVDYEKIRKSEYFVDKTMMLNDICNDNPKALLITYPHGWGKSVNLQMVGLYFNERDSERSQRVFKETAIVKCTTCLEIQEEQCKYPVIFVDFKDVAADDSYLKFLTNMKKAIAQTFKQHQYLEEKLQEPDLQEFKYYLQETPTEDMLEYERVQELEKDRRSIRNDIKETKKTKIEHSSDEAVSRNATVEKLLKKEDVKNKEIVELKGNVTERFELHITNSLFTLATYLLRVTGKPAVVLIDDYDSPVRDALLKAKCRSFLDKIFRVFNNLITSMFEKSSDKEATPLKLAIITGITNILKENSLISEHNTLKNHYFKHYGFTKSEVSALFKGPYKKKFKDDLEITKDGLQLTFAGYRVSNDLNEEFYNPLSVVESLKKNFITQSFLSEVGSMAELEPLLLKKEFRPVVENLISGGTELLHFTQLRFTPQDFQQLQQIIHDGMKFTKNEKTAILRFLYAMGYLTLTSAESNALAFSTGHGIVTAANWEVRTYLSNLPHKKTRKPENSGP